VRLGFAAAQVSVLLLQLGAHGLAGPCPARGLRGVEPGAVARRTVAARVAARRDRVVHLQPAGARLFDLPTWDINATPKVFPRALYDALELKADGDLIDLEFYLKCRRLDQAVLEVPIYRWRRHSDRSTTNLSTAVRLYVGATRIWWRSGRGAIWRRPSGRAEARDAPLRCVDTPRQLVVVGSIPDRTRSHRGPVSPTHPSSRRWGLLDGRRVCSMSAAAPGGTARSRPGGTWPRHQARTSARPTPARRAKPGFRAADVAEVAREGASFDLVLLVDILHHLDAEQGSTCCEPSAACRVSHRQLRARRRAAEVARPLDRRPRPRRQRETPGRARATVPARGARHRGEHTAVARPIHTRAILARPTGGGPRDRQAGPCGRGASRDGRTEARSRPLAAGRRPCRDHSLRLRRNSESRLRLLRRRQVHHGEPEPAGRPDAAEYRLGVHDVLLRHLASFDLDSYLVDVQLWVRAGGHHLGALALHTANTLLLFGVLLRATQRRPQRLRRRAVRVTPCTSKSSPGRPNARTC